MHHLASGWRTAYPICLHRADTRVSHTHSLLPKYCLHCVQCIDSFELVIWFVPNLGVNAAMVALIGLVFGPMYPITISVAARILPRQVFLGGVGWIAGFGQAGSAAVPFITGAIAQKYGIKNLHPTWVIPICSWSLARGLTSTHARQSNCNALRHDDFALLNPRQAFAKPGGFGKGGCGATFNRKGRKIEIQTVYHDLPQKMA